MRLKAQQSRHQPASIVGTRPLAMESLAKALLDFADHIRTRYPRDFDRHSPDDSETSVESSEFAASLQARREIWLATSSSRSPKDGRGVDLAIFPGIWTHSFCRLLLNDTERPTLALVVAAAAVPR